MFSRKWLSDVVLRDKNERDMPAFVGLTYTRHESRLIRLANSSDKI
jgi:hypothetical protein